MRISVLASGSKGNCTYVETLGNKILIDIGMSNLYVEKKLVSLGVRPSDINGIFITHTHVDHIAGLKVFIKKYHPTIFLTSKMYEELKDFVKDYVIIENKINLGDLTVDFFKTSHDASDSLGYVFKNNDKEFVYVTDTGYINAKNLNLLVNKDLYVFESNHDVELLMSNANYPYHIKQRILGDKGHLSNVQCGEYLKKVVGDKTQTIILAHLSEQNNDHELALNNIRNKVSDDVKVMVAKQNENTELIEI